LPEAAPRLVLTAHHGIVALIGLGTPVHQVSRLTRHPVEAFATIDRFDGEPVTPSPPPRP
jgi:hypothetical protein